MNELSRAAGHWTVWSDKSVNKFSHKKRLRSCCNEYKFSGEKVKIITNKTTTLTHKKRKKMRNPPRNLWNLGYVAKIRLIITWGDWKLLNSESFDQEVSARQVLWPKKSLLVEGKWNSGKPVHIQRWNERKKRLREVREGRRGRVWWRLSGKVMVMAVGDGYGVGEYRE